MENYIWSLDISTTNIGSALWNYEGKLIELKHLALRIKKDVPEEFRDLTKADLFRQYCEDYKKRVHDEFHGNIKHIFVEAPLSNTPKNINTTALLLGFNGMARYILLQVFGFMPEKISVHKARTSFCPELVHHMKIKEVLSFPKEYRSEKKLYIWKKVAKLEPQIQWFYKKNKPDEPRDICFDMSDSYAVGFAGLKKLGIIK